MRQPRNAMVAATWSPRKRVKATLVPHKEDDYNVLVGTEDECDQYRPSFLCHSPFLRDQGLALLCLVLPNKFPRNGGVFVARPTRSTFIMMKDLPYTEMWVQARHKKNPASSFSLPSLSCRRGLFPPNCATCIPYYVFNIQTTFFPTLLSGPLTSYKTTACGNTFSISSLPSSSSSSS